MLFLRSAAFNLVFYAMSVVIVIAATPCLVLPRRFTLYAMEAWSHLTLWLLRVIAGTHYEVRGELPRGGVLVASKHQSMWDTIVMTAILKDPAMVLKRELLWIPFYGWYAQKARMIAIDRGAAAAAIRRLVSQGKAAVAEGRPVVIFPEGTRSAPGSKLEYKPGVAALYRQVFIEVFSQVQELDYSGIGWTDVDALIDALSTKGDDGSSANACPRLRYLWLFDNPIANPTDAFARLHVALGDGCEICGLT